MKESFWGKSKKEEPEKMSRRKFLGMASAALTDMTVGGVIGTALLKGKEREGESVTNYDSNGLGELLTQEESEKPARSFEGISNSKFFITEIVKQADRYDSELPIVLEFANVIAEKDPEGRTCIEYLQQMYFAEGVPEVAMAEIKKQIVGLVFEESRFDPERVSDAQAITRFQIIYSTWKDLSREGEDISSFVDQTRIAGKLLAQTYQHLLNTAGKELRQIETNFFHGDTEEFERCFLAPVLINSYNAGMGNMAELVQWFAKKYDTPEKTVGLFDQDKKLSGHDVFMAMAKQGMAEEAVETYKKYASAYTFKVYGAAMCLLRHPVDGKVA